LAGKELTVRYLRADPADFAALQKILQETPSSLLVVGGAEPIKRMPALEAILAKTAIPVFLVRNMARQETDTERE
jgi:hypothetical protein